MTKKLFAIATFALCTLALAAPSQAQHSRGGAPASAGRVAAPRGSVGGGRVVAPYRGYYRGGYYPGFYGGFYGYPYYSPYYYPWGFYGSWGYPYGYGFGYGYDGYGYGGYPYPYYYNSDAVRGLGGLRIVDAPKSAQVYADGYYAGNVDDFNGAFQHLDLEAGPHTIEIRPEGAPRLSFQVNIVPGETITYHAK